MNILIVGYGKMGKTIEQIAVKRGHTIAGRIDVGNQQELNNVKADVAIEFSHPDAAFENVRKCIERNIPVVCGTTGWLQRKDEIESLARQRNGAFFYASNYSLGVNIFFRLNEYLSRMMSAVGEYNVELEEIHHTEKKDSPSGTAITLAEGVLKNFRSKKKWVNDKTNAADDLFINSIRMGKVPGTHTVKYSSVMDDIEIRHTAHTREAFALGAVMVAEWVKEKKGILTMDDFLKLPQA